MSSGFDIDVFLKAKEISEDALISLKTTVYQKIYDSFVNYSLEETMKELDVIADHIDGIGVLIGEGRSEDVRKGMSLGAAKALLDLTNALVVEHKEKAAAEKAVSVYRHLEDFLILIYKEGIVSGPKIEKKLRFTGRSARSNFLLRIKPLDYYGAQKIGQTKFYSLTPKGVSAAQTLMEKSTSKEKLNENAQWVCKFISNYTQTFMLAYEKQRDIYDELLKALLRTQIEVPNSTMNHYSKVFASVLKIESENFEKRRILSIKVNEKLKKGINEIPISKDNPLFLRSEDDEEYSYVSDDKEFNTSLYKIERCLG